MHMRFLITVYAKRGEQKRLRFFFTEASVNCRGWMGKAVTKVLTELKKCVNIVYN